MIIKKLKFATFTYDEQTREFNVIGSKVEVGNTLVFNKTYAYAFMRFVLRISQRNWYRKKVIKNE